MPAGHDSIAGSHYHTPAGLADQVPGRILKPPDKFKRLAVRTAAGKRGISDNINKYNDTGFFLSRQISFFRLPEVVKQILLTAFPLSVFAQDFP
jgi:hypothetical protein